jgi:TonB-linked SusC/RagA family outer membrane protein
MNIYLPIKKKIKIVFLLCLIFAKLQSIGQTIDIAGQVVNEKNEIVPFATITIKGTKHVVTADNEGKFKLTQVQEQLKLIISSTGYETQEYTVLKKVSFLLIKLNLLSQELQEVKVVSNGLQDIPKERITGSFTKIDENTINQQTGTNILKRLDGVSSGLMFNIGKTNNNPQNKTNIAIRGLSTINGALDPLIVLDGFIYEGNIDNINPNDVASITLLKDATATSIWGARAGNGVIVITSKKGKFNQRATISINSNVIVSEKPDLFYLKQMSSEDYIDVEQFLFNKGYFNSRINSNWQALTPAVQVFLNKRNGRITSMDSANQINALKDVDSRNQYNKYIYRKAVTQQYSISLRGGGERFSYGLSVNHDYIIGELYNKNRKLNVKLDNSFNPLKNLRIDLSFYYTNSNSTSGRSGYNNISPGGRQIPYLSLADKNGNPLPVSTIYRDSYIDTAGSGKLLDWRFYPLDDYKYLKNSVNLQEIFSSLGMNYKLFRFLDIDLKYQYQNQLSQNEQMSYMESFYTRNLINTFSQLDRSTGLVTYRVPLGAIRTLGNSIVESQTVRGQINFNKSSNIHRISGILGSEVRQTKSSGSNNVFYGYNEDPLIYSNVDFVTPYRTFVNGTYQTIPGALSFSNVTARFVSLYTNMSYTLKDRYIISASARKDGSNIFGANTNDRWRPLWSVGTAWNLSDENFYSLSAIPFFKVRITYGYSGNLDLSKSAVVIGRYFPTAAYTNFSFARNNTINNPDLRWEKTGQLNMAIDFSFVENILSGSVEYYIKKGTDLYGTAPYDYTTWGFTREVTRNVAEMKGKGVDVLLNTKNINKTFKWETNLLFNYNINKVTDYKSIAAQSVLPKLGGGTSITAAVGKPLYAIAAYKWGGLDRSGNPQGFVNGNKSIDYQAIFSEARTKGESGNIVYIGSSTPTLFGSLINTLSYKGVTLSFNLSFKGGYYFQKSSISYNSLINSGAGHSEYSDRWKTAGDELKTNVPSFIYPNNSNRDQFYLNSEVNVLKGDHVRLQYINISHTIKNFKNKRVDFKELQLYANAANLGIIGKANKLNLDPDYPSTLPPSKTFTVGIRAKF